MNSKTLVVCLITFGLIIAALITLNGDIAWMALPFLAYLGLGILQTPAAEKVRLSVQRNLTQTRAGETASVEVNLSVRNESDEEIQCLICDTDLMGMNVTDGKLSQWASLRAGESTELKYTFTANRGDFSWKDVEVVVTDPLNLIENEMSIPANASIQVRPQLKRFKMIPLRPHSTLHSPGSIPANLGGSGTDFFGVREYQPGDPLRSLDWRMTARHPRKFFTKEFEQEEIAEIGLLLDARKSTNLQIGEESLFEHSVSATGSLAEVFLHQGHRVSLLVFGGGMLNVLPGYGKVQFHRIMSCLSKAQAKTESRSTAHLDFIPIRMFPSHALVIVISSLTSSDFSLFKRLSAYGYQGLLICPNPIDFARETFQKDELSQMAIRAAHIERRLRLDSIAQLRIPVIDWKVQQPLYPLVRNALTRSRGQREQ
jgi:uncharacterized protein (DUF58 family)